MRTNNYDSLGHSTANPDGRGTHLYISHAAKAFNGLGLGSGTGTVLDDGRGPCLWGGQSWPRPSSLGRPVTCFRQGALKGACGQD